MYAAGLRPDSLLSSSDGGSTWAPESKVCRPACHLAGAEGTIYLTGGSTTDYLPLYDRIHGLSRDIVSGPGVENTNLCHKQLIRFMVLDPTSAVAVRLCWVV